MKKLFFAGCSAGLAVTAALSNAPVQAAWMGCGAGSTSAMVQFSDLAAAGSCQVGDKLYSDFDFTIGTADPLAVIRLGNPVGDQHTLQGQASAWTNGTFNYKVTAVGSEQIIAIKFDSSSSLFSPNYQWTAAAPELGVTPAVTLTPGTSSIGPLYGGPTTVVNVSHTLNNQGADPMQSWTDTVRQTPGPLPILGAGAAFGFSRKLRNRIKKAA